MRHNVTQSKSSSKPNKPETLPVWVKANPFVPIDQLTDVHLTASKGPYASPFYFQRTTTELTQKSSKKSVHKSAHNSTHRQTRESSEELPKNRLKSCSAVQVCDFELTDFDFAIIRRKAKQLIGKYGFRNGDLEDLQQELTYRLLKAAPAFDPQRSHRRVFTTTVVDRNAATIIRAQRTKKRDYRCETSFTDLAGCQPDSGTTWREQNFLARQDTSYTELQQDLAEAIDQLPGDLRQLAISLREKSITEIHRQTAESRYKLNRKIQRLRQHLEKAGVDRSSLN